MKKSLLNALKYNVTSWRWVPFCKKMKVDNFSKNPPKKKGRRRGHNLKRENCNMMQRAAYGMVFYQRAMTIKINKT